MATYLVTGVAGFIGSTLARELLAQGQRVRGLDNFSTGKRENVAELRGQIDLHEADLLDLDALHQACGGVDYVMHEAAIPSVPRSVKDPLGNNQANVDGTLNLLVACRDAKVKRVVYAASSSAYGDTPTLPKREDMPPNPISPYATAKLASEYYMTSFYRCYGLETVCLRYFNVFGPRQDPGSPYSGVLSLFNAALLNGTQPAVYGDGEQSRDFTYVANVVQANLLACTAKGTAGLAINVGTGNRYTLNHTLALLERITGLPAMAKYFPPRGGDIRDSQADISQAKELLGYSPQIGFEEGLRCTWEWFSRESAQTQLDTFPAVFGTDIGGRTANKPLLRGST
jgi:nucleoside-diphosphate-sugar epimerase